MSFSNNRLFGTLRAPPLSCSGHELNYRHIPLLNRAYSHFLGFPETGNERNAEGLQVNGGDTMRSLLLCN